MISYGRQDISEEDIAAVVAVLRSKSLTQGQMVPAFERALANWTGAAEVAAVNSATSALHLACVALGANASSRIWTSPNTFVASANCALYCGASIDFVDIELDTGNMDMACLAEKLQQAEDLPDIVIPVHFAGQPCDLAALRALADQYGFRVIEDASHALGATYGDSRIGDCRFSDATVFSFHPVKMITTGEGGAVATHDVELAARLRQLRSHGITRDPEAFVAMAADPWGYEQQSLGFNYRMNDIEAALGLSQLGRLPEFLNVRRTLAAQYQEAFASVAAVRPLDQCEGRNSSWHLFVIKVAAASRGRIFSALRDSGIGVNVHYIPVYRQPWFTRMGFLPSRFPAMEAYYEQVITLPLHTLLSGEDQTAVVSSLIKNLEA